MCSRSSRSSRENIPPMPIVPWPIVDTLMDVLPSVTQASVPLLSKIPGLGWLFKSKSINRKNTELLIFITPRISAKAGVQEDNG